MSTGGRFCWIVSGQWIMGQLWSDGIFRDVSLSDLPDLIGVIYCTNIDSSVTFLGVVSSRTTFNVNFKPSGFHDY